MKFHYGFTRPSLRLFQRSVIAAALLLSAVSGILAETAPRAVAADPELFEAAQVTPANIASFVALSTDLTSPQMLLAQELLARISGGAFEPADVETSVEDMLPGDIEGMPQPVDGQVAIAVQPQQFDLNMFAGVLDESLSSPELDNVSDSIENAQVESLAGLSVILTAANADEIGAFLLEELSAEASAQGVPLATVEYPDGSTIYVLEGQVDPTGGDDALEAGAFAQLGSAIVLGARVEDVEPFVLTSAGELPSLAADPGYQEAMATLPAEVLVGGYSSGLNAEDLSLVQEMLNEASVPIALDLITQGIGPSAFALQASEEGFRFETATLPDATDAGTPTAALSSPVELALADRVSGDTLMLVSGTDLANSAVIRAAEQLVLLLLSGTADGEETSLTRVTEQLIADQYQGLEMLLGFNAQTELFRQLTGEFGLVVSSVDLSDPEGFGVLFVSGVDQPDVVDGSLTSLGALLQILGEGAPPVEQVTIGEATVNQVTIESDGSTIDVQYGVMGDQLVVGVGSSIVEYVLGTPDVLSANPLYVEALSNLPEAETGIFYLNTPEVVELGTMVASLFMVDTFDESFGSVSVSVDDDTGVVDAGERCGDYLDREAAQSAYDADPITNFDLDFDFDGVACDDFFDEEPAGSASSSVAIISLNVGAIAAVSYVDGTVERTSGILIVPVA